MTPADRCITCGWPLADDTDPTGERICSVCAMNVIENVHRPKLTLHLEVPEYHPRVVTKGGARE